MGELRAAEKLLHRVMEAAGCPDEESGGRVVARVKRLHDEVLGTHRPVTPAEGGPDMCGDCGADIEDAIDEARLCRAYGGRETTEELVALRARVTSAMVVAERFGGIDGDHHKTWVIDQMMRALLDDRYDDWRRAYEAATDESGELMGSWPEGIPP